MKKIDLKKNDLPQNPGVYFFMKGKEVLYIGKATNLKDRVNSYFSKDLIKTRGPMILDMVVLATSVKYQKTDTAIEALILESNLIKKYQPKYNTKEKDNKSFNYVCITEEKFPRVLVVRGRGLVGTRVPVCDNFSRFTPEGPYADKNSHKQAPNQLDDNFSRLKYSKIFGPFPNGLQLREAMKIIRKIFPYIDNDSAKKNNVEFYKQLGLVPDSLNSFALVKDDTLNNYKNNIKNIALFFEGKKKKIINDLKKEMMFFAKSQNFEKAIEIKKKLFALNHINEISLIKDNFDNNTDFLPSFRIEAYDISHMSGQNMVGVMVVVANGNVSKNQYRKFIVKTVENTNDTKALSEIIERRFSHSDWSKPDIVVVDGGQAQFDTAKKVLNKLKIKIPVLAVLKDSNHKPKAIIGDEKLALKYKKEILLANSESHRFAIGFHKQKRRNNFIK